MTRITVTFSAALGRKLSLHQVATMYYCVAIPVLISELEHRRDSFSIWYSSILAPNVQKRRTTVECPRNEIKTTNSLSLHDSLFSEGWHSWGGWHSNIPSREHVFTSWNCLWLMYYSISLGFIRWFTAVLAVPFFLATRGWTRGIPPFIELRFTHQSLGCISNIPLTYCHTY